MDLRRNITAVEDINQSNGAMFVILRLISKQNKLFLVSVRRADIGTREMFIRGPYRLAN